MRGIHRSSVDSRYQWCGAIVFFVVGLNKLLNKQYSCRRFEALWRSYNLTVMSVIHDDVIKWKHFPRYWPLVRGIHRSPVNSPHKGQWRRALMFSLICAWINSWVNNREAGDLRRHRAHYDVIVMSCANTDDASANANLDSFCDKFWCMWWLVICMIIYEDAHGWCDFSTLLLANFIFFLRKSVSLLIVMTMLQLYRWNLPYTAASSAIIVISINNGRKWTTECDPVTPYGIGDHD